MCMCASRLVELKLFMQSKTMEAKQMCTCLCSCEWQKKADSASAHIFQTKNDFVTFFLAKNFSTFHQK